MNWDDAFAMIVFTAAPLLAPSIRALLLQLRLASCSLPAHRCRLMLVMVLGCCLRRSDTDPNALS